ncbi:uncharacterized protein RB166_017849 [Leptodactylus fuscus]
MRSRSSSLSSSPCSLSWRCAHWRRTCADTRAVQSKVQLRQHVVGRLAYGSRIPLAVTQDGGVSARRSLCKLRTRSHVAYTPSFVYLGSLEQAGLTSGYGQGANELVGLPCAPSNHWMPPRGSGLEDLKIKNLSGKVWRIQHA